MLIPFVTRSRFLPAIDAELKAAGACLEPGRSVTVRLEGGGYRGTVEVEISAGPSSEFEAGVEIADVTRFPVRIRAAATALREHHCWGRYEITHQDGTLTILRLP